MNDISITFEALGAFLRESAVLVAVFGPLETILRGERLAMAWVVENGRAVERQVRLGTGRVSDPSGEWVEVVDGLRPGDDLIDADPATLEPGRAVRSIGESR